MPLDANDSKKVALGPRHSANRHYILVITARSSAVIGD